jgi:hypothetical protein
MQAKLHKYRFYLLVELDMTEIKLHSILFVEIIYSTK